MNRFDKLLLKLGYSKTVNEKLPKKASYTCEERLQHIADLGESIGIIYDCGAFIGRWAQAVNSIFPEAKIVLIEPNPELQSEIEERTSSFKEKTKIIQAAVGQSEGSAKLNVWKNSMHTNKLTALAGSSLLSHVQGEASDTFSVQVKTIDDIAIATNWSPDLIKLDLQGYEREALLGARYSLENAKIVVTEFGCLQAYENRTSPSEIFEILTPHGFLLYDIVDLRYRPYDNALAGGDFIFVKRDSKLWDHKDYF